jgi:hypothetical protein
MDVQYTVRRMCGGFIYGADTPAGSKHASLDGLALLGLLAGKAGPLPPHRTPPWMATPPCLTSGKRRAPCLLTGTAVQIL